MSVTTFCSEDCTIYSAPAISSFCTDTIIAGGIKHIGILSCNARFGNSAPIDVETPAGGTISVGAYDVVASWQELKDASMVSLTPEGLGSLPAPEVATVRYRSCRPEQTSNHTFTVNFRWYQADTDGVVLGDVRPDIASIENLSTNPDRFRIFFIGCDTNYIYLPADVSAATTGLPGWEYSGEPYIEIPETNDEDASIVWNVSFKQRSGLVRPYYLPGVYDAIKTATTT